MKFGSSSAYSFGRQTKCKLEKTDLLTNPGPGTYQPTNLSKTTPSWKIGREERGKLKSNEIPGPGTYNYGNTLSGPKFSIRLKTPNLADTSRYNVSPGPANYSPNFKTLYKNFSYTMRSRPNTAKTDTNPGPGNYNLRTEKSLLVPTYKFGSEKKLNPLLTSNRFTPGPGNYNLGDESGLRAPKFSFGKELRGQNERPKTPGPGTYQLRACVGNEGPKISISGYRPLSSMSSNRNNMPGPGTYSTNFNDRPKSPSYRIGSSKRAGNNREAELIPGVGAYSPLNMSLSNRPKSPTWSMGKGLRRNVSYTDFVPGPGNYETRSKLGDGPKFSMKGKYNLDKKSFVPGPGAYNDSQKNLHKNPSWRIGTSTRDDALKKTMRENFPGPGNYNSITERTIPTFKFGTELRDKRHDNLTPGPGQYHIPYSMMDVPRYLTTGGGFNNSFRYI